MPVMKNPKTKKQKKKVMKQVMDEWKSGELNVGKSKKKVKSQAQAVAIGLSMSKQSKRKKRGKKKKK